MEYEGNSGRDTMFSKAQKKHQLQSAHCGWSKSGFIDSVDVRKEETISGCNTIWNMPLFSSKAIALQWFSVCGDWMVPRLQLLWRKVMASDPSRFCISVQACLFIWGGTYLSLLWPLQSYRLFPPYSSVIIQLPLNGQGHCSEAGEASLEGRRARPTLPGHLHIFT